MGEENRKFLWQLSEAEERGMPASKQAKHLAFADDRDE